MSKHTKGPWHLDKLSDTEWQINSDEVDYCLFQITPTIGKAKLTREDKANAKLAAAAPDLLDALCKLVSAVESTDRDSLRELIAAHAAIAKATK